MQGEYAESCFVVECLRRGFAVAKPYGDSTPYDFLVEVGGKISRVQVKSVFRRSPDGAYYLGIRHNTSQGRRSAYRLNDFDLLAAYLMPRDIWYIIPIRSVAGIQAIGLYPGHVARRLERYRNAWRLLLPSAASHSQRQNAHGIVPKANS